MVIATELLGPVGELAAWSVGTLAVGHVVFAEGTLDLLGGSGCCLGRPVLGGTKHM